MNYILIGALFSLGWHMVKLIWCMVDEIVYKRLHRTKWYKILCFGMDNKTGKVKTTVKMKIGF